MREELYRKLTGKLGELCIDVAGEYYLGGKEMDADAPERAIKHIDLWNHNVEFIEQEQGWERPAVFVEFQPIQWQAIVTGVEYRAQAVINLHVVTDWTEISNIDQFRLLGEMHKLIAGLEGETFADLDLIGSTTNHNHEEIVENIESYSCVAFRSLR